MLSTAFSKSTRRINPSIPLLLHLCIKPCIRRVQSLIDLSSRNPFRSVLIIFLSTGRSLFVTQVETNLYVVLRRDIGLQFFFIKLLYVVYQF